MNKDKIIGNKKDDKKAIKGFFIIMIVSGLIGGVIGFLTSFAKDNLIQPVANVMMNLLWVAVPYGNLIITAVGGAFILYFYRKAKFQFKSWDGDDEVEINRIEMLLSYVIWISSVIMILSFFFFAAGLTVNIGDIFDTISRTNLILWFVGYFVAVTVTIITQQRVVNFEKIINPEKQGSVFELNFQKKWVNTCDEAERMNIYQSSFKAYKTVTMTCVILWLFCVLGMTMWDLGIMPVAMVTIIWLVQTTSYCMESIRISKYKNER